MTGGGLLGPEPLSGLLVVELSTGVLGPMCGVYLSDMGAEVIKVEPPGGDLARCARGAGNTLPREAASPFFAAVNRGKRSVVLDGLSEAGRTALRRLVGTADVFLSNYRPEALERLGVDEEAVRPGNERLVYAVATGFGPTGSDAGRPMVDGSGQARGGLAAVTGPQGEAALAGAVVADSAGGMLLALGVVTALLGRERSGTGQRVETSALGGQLWLQSWELAHASMTGFRPVPAGAHHPIFAGVYGLYRTADDAWLFIAGIPDPDDWLTFCAFGDIDSAARDPRWDTNQKRTGFDPSVSTDEANQLRPDIARAIGRHTLAEWEQFLQARPEIISHRVQDYEQVLRDPQGVANGYFAQVDVFGAGPQRLVGNVVALSQTPGSVKDGPPVLGADTTEVLQSLGYTAADAGVLVADAAEALVRRLPAMHLKPTD